MNKEELMRRALIWALDEGVGWSGPDKWNGQRVRYHDTGCGCCSGEETIPDEFKELFDSLEKERFNT